MRYLGVWSAVLGANVGAALLYSGEATPLRRGWASQRFIFSSARMATTVPSPAEVARGGGAMQGGGDSAPLSCVFVLGGPGSGKGTQCALLSDQYGYVHISAGDLLRAERKKGGKIGKMIDDFIKEGKIVPSSITVKLLRSAMERSGSKRFLIDGFPRSEENLQSWQREMEGVVDVDYLLFLDCPEDIMVQRVLQRGLSSGRSDDNEVSIRKRLQTYAESTMPIIDYFTKEGKTLKVDANQPVPVVFDAIKPYLATPSDDASTD